MVTLGNFVGEKYLLVSANVEPRSQTHTSCCVVDVETGAWITPLPSLQSRHDDVTCGDVTGVFVSGTFAFSENSEVLRRMGDVCGMGALLQEKDEAHKRLQFVGVGENGDCTNRTNNATCLLEFTA